MNKEIVVGSLEELCDDAVSRQAVDEMIKAEMPERGMWEIEGDKEKETVCEVCVDLMQKLSDLPSVRPRINCQYRHENGNCLKVGGFCTSVDDKYCPSFCDDAVSRQAVLDLFDGMGVHETIDISILCAIIKNLPPVRPQEQTGHWKHREDMDYLDKNKVMHEHFMCQDCGFIHDFIDGNTAQYNYCPNCGARMESEE